MVEPPNSEASIATAIELCPGYNANAAGAGRTMEFWNSIDGVLVINMASRTDRWKSFVADIVPHLPAGKVYRISGVDGTKIPGYKEFPWFRASTGNRTSIWGGTAGCVLAHRRCLEFAREKGWRNVLILEDDIHLLGLTADTDAVLSRLLAKNAGKPYLFYLGFNRPVPCGLCVYKHGAYEAWSVDGVLSAHSYVVSSPLYDVLLKRLPQEDEVWEWLSRYRAVDTFYRDYVSAAFGVGVYVIYPMLFRQSRSYSNIMQCQYDVERFICDSPPVSYTSLKGMGSLVGLPFKRLLVRLNSIRRHRRALRKGLPGYHKPKKK